MSAKNKSSNTASSSQATLQGWRIALTASADDPYMPIKLLQQRQAELYFYPVSQTLPPEGYTDLDAALHDAAKGKINWLLLTTPCAVEAVAERLAQLDIATGKLAKFKVATYGAKTAIVAQKIFPDWTIITSAAPDHAALIESMQLTATDTVLVPLAQRSRADWSKLLRTTGAMTIAPQAYRLILGRGGDDLPGLLWGGEIDALIFATENSVRHFSIRLKAEGGTLDMLNDVVVICLDPQTADAAQAYGLSAQIVPEKYTPNTFVQTIVEHLSLQPV